MRADNPVPRGFVATPELASQFYALFLEYPVSFECRDAVEEFVKGRRGASLEEAPVSLLLAQFGRPIQEAIDLISAVGGDLLGDPPLMPTPQSVWASRHKRGEV